MSLMTSKKRVKDKKRNNMDLMKMNREKEHLNKKIQTIKMNRSISNLKILTN